MLKKLLPALVLATVALAPARAQDANWRPCGSAELQRQYFAEHPGAERAYQQMQEQADRLNAQQRNTAVNLPPDKTVPVVVHILYYNIPANNTVPPSYITDAQVNGFIGIVNRDYRKANPDTIDIVSPFVPANPRFQFRLAKLDPQGNCTTGITRHYSFESDFGTGGALGVNGVSSVVYWPPNKYMNVWVVNGIATMAGGYTFGGAGLCNGGSVDGIVILRSQFGQQTSNLPTRSMTHEIGHYFSLAHTWGGSNTPGQAGNCSLDDNIADTPNTVGVTGGGCPLTMASCPGSAVPIANVQNYMDYADCEKMFSQQQVDRMRGLTITSSCRINLISQANLVATGTNDGYAGGACAPIADFQPVTNTVCEGGQISFRSYSYNLTAAGNPTSYLWTFQNGTGTPVTSTSQAPTVSYPVAGVYDVTLTVTNAAGSNTKTATQLVYVNGASAGESLPFADSFENAAYPVYYPAPSQRNYRTFSASSTGYPSFTAWQRRTASSSVAAADGVAFLQVPNNGLPTAAVATLITPNIDLTRIVSGGVLSFSEYFGARTPTSTASLAVEYSTDCANTWQPLATLLATQLNVNSGVASPASASDWRNIQLPIPTSAQLSSTFQLRFQFRNNTAAVDNPFYFDKLAITGVLGTHAAALARRDIGVYPNPLTNETAVHVTLPASASVQISLTDVVGHEVLTVPAKTYPAGPQAIALPLTGRTLPAGVYVVRIALGGETFSSKLTVQ